MENEEAEKKYIKKKIGATTYEVSVNYKETSTESVQDKLRRIILNDTSNVENHDND